MKKGRSRLNYLTCWNNISQNPSFLLRHWWIFRAAAATQWFISSAGPTAPDDVRSCGSVEVWQTLQIMCHPLSEGDDRNKPLNHPGHLQHLSMMRQIKRKVWNKNLQWKCWINNILAVGLSVLINHHCTGFSEKQWITFISLSFRGLFFIILYISFCLDLHPDFTFFTASTQLCGDVSSCLHESVSFWEAF